MQDKTITSFLKMNSRTTVTVSPTNDITDPLFDDWLVQDALEDDDDGYSSKSSSSQPATPAVAPVPHRDLPPQALTGLTAALETLIKQPSPPPSPGLASPRGWSDRECRPMKHPEKQEQEKKRRPDGRPVDEVILKRQKNTDAARRSRLKKALKMETLETRVADLEKIHQGLMLRVAVLDSEKQGLASKEASYEDRIKRLEAQLAETHRTLARKVAAPNTSSGADADTDPDADADPDTDEKADA